MVSKIRDHGLSLHHLGLGIWALKEEARGRKVGKGAAAEAAECRHYHQGASVRRARHRADGTSAPLHLGDARSLFLFH